jgi:hypothetical protein
VAITLVSDSATIGTTEHWLASDSTTKSDQTEDVVLQAWIDFGAMAAGDVYEWRVVEKVNAGTQRDVVVQRVVGVQASPIIIPGFVLGDGWEIGVKKISGTDRSIAWSLRKLT